MTGARDVSLVLPANFALCVLFPNTLILSKNSVNTFVEAKKVPLIRDIGFAERERETFA